MMGPRLNYLHKLRLRVFAILVGTGLAAIGVLTIASLPAIPVLGVAVITVAAMVHRVTSKLAHSPCHGCGAELRGVPGNEHGIACPTCGSVNQPHDAPARNA